MNSSITSPGMFLMTNMTNDPTRGVGDQDSQMEEENCKLFPFVIYVPVFGSVGVLGLVGNTLSFVVMHLEKRNKVARFLLQSLAFADNLFLVTTVAVQMFSGMGLYLDWQLYEKANPYLMVYIWPFIHITQLLTVWMTVLVSLNRYIAICMPFRAHKLCSLKVVRIQVAFLCFFSFFYNIPRFMEYELKYNYKNSTTNPNITFFHSVEGKESDMKLSPYYTVIYENCLYCLFVFLGPLVILIIMNVRLINELVRARKRLSQQSIKMPGEEEEQNLTLVMVVIVVIFVICQTPAFVNILLGFVLGNDAYACKKPYFYYYHLSNLFVASNSATNFFVYFVFRKSFRERLSACCGRITRRASLHHNGSMALMGPGDRTVNTYISNRDEPNGEPL